MEFNYRPKVFAASLITVLLITFNLGIISSKFSLSNQITTLTGRPAQTRQPQPSPGILQLQTSISRRIERLSRDSQGGFYANDINYNDISFEDAEAPVVEPENEVYPAASAQLLGFIEQVVNGEAAVVRGVYVEGVFALPVVQQPQGEVAFVSSAGDTITEFQSAAAFGVTGLLAHNYLSGKLYYFLEEGHEVIIVYGDGKIRRYQIEGIYQFERLEPSNMRSRFVDLSDNRTLTSDQVFDRFYRGEHRVTFQTCLERYGISNWGLTFVVAEPVSDGYLIPTP